jgi:hypothetical protein
MVILDGKRFCAFTSAFGRLFFLDLRAAEKSRRDFPAARRSELLFGPQGRNAQNLLPSSKML